MKKLIIVATLVALTLTGCEVQEDPPVVYTAKVTEKAVKKSNDEDKYMIFTKLSDGTVRVFEDTDSIWFGKNNSSDVYAGIEVGHTYNFTVRGVREPAFSLYENIFGVEEVRK